MKKNRPQFMPREIKSTWPGITYCDEYGLQVRVTVNGQRRSRYYAYRSFKGNALAAHKAAAKWRMELLAGKVFKLRARLREREVQRRADGVVAREVVLSVQRPDGTRTLKQWHIGTANTVTAKRRAAVKRTAQRFLDAYRSWFEQGGRHPMEVRHD